MSSTMPSTPENTPRKMALNRSFTLPAKVASTSRTAPTAEIGATEGVETLYIHPNAKIVKFTSASRPGSSTGTSGQNQTGTLPWATLTEQTIAAGPVEIYRVPGSVSFLHSGSLLHAIMPRSNCWCVDGVSKFAIRVLPETYYRIELPRETPEHLEKVEEFKETLKKVLFYERTACPFARTFTVTLPDQPEVVAKRRRRTHGPAKKWKLDKAYSWKPEDGEEPLDHTREAEDESDSLTASEEDEASSSNEDAPTDQSRLADQVKDFKLNSPSTPSVRERAMGFNMRSVTAPPQLSLQSTPPSRLRTTFVLDEAGDAHESHSTQPSSSQQQVPGALDTASLRPFQSIPTDMPPSPPDSSTGYDYTEQNIRPTMPQRAGSVPEQSSADSVAVSSAALPTQQNAAGESPLPSADQWDAKPRAVAQYSEVEADQIITPAQTQPNRLFVTEQSPKYCVVLDEQDPEAGVLEDDVNLNSRERNQHASLPKITSEVESAETGAKPTTTTVAQKQQQPDDGRETAGVAVASAVEAQPVDPFAQIQARIQARRSIGGTTSFHPSVQSPTRQSSASTASSSTSLSSSARTGGTSSSRRSHVTRHQHHQQAFATALVKRAATVFLGPPAHLVIIMLRIAARFAKGAFPGSFLFESPAGMSKRVPGSFDLDGSDVEDFDSEDDGEDEFGDYWGEDDFGVPLRSPVRLAAIGESLSRSVSHEDSEGIRERRTWEKEMGP